MTKNLTENIQNYIVVHKIHKEHKAAKRVLNKALCKEIEYTDDVLPYCGYIHNILYQFDAKHINKYIQKYGSCPVKPIANILRPSYNETLCYTQNKFQRTYIDLLYTVWVIAAFMDRYELGAKDWSTKAKKHVEQFLNFQPTYDPNINLNDFITKPQRIYTVIEAGYDLRLKFPHQSV